MLSSIILVILVVTAVVASTTGRQPPWALQPATVTRRTGRVPKRGPGMGHSVSPTDEEQKRSVIDVLRFFGLARRAVPRPIVGRRAYVRWWERLRAAIVLSAIVIGLGFVLAAIIGIVVLGAGFLLEQAIS